MVMLAVLATGLMGVELESEVSAEAEDEGVDDDDDETEDDESGGRTGFVSAVFV